jgi:hypothetical protein
VGVRTFGQGPQYAPGRANWPSPHRRASHIASVLSWPLRETVTRYLSTTIVCAVHRIKVELTTLGWLHVSFPARLRHSSTERGGGYEGCDRLHTNAPPVTRRPR